VALDVRISACFLFSVAYGWSRRARVALFVVSTGVPAAVVVGVVTGWSRSALGVPPWTSWTLAAVAGLPLAWGSTPLGTKFTTDILLKAYRREWLAVAEQRYLSRVAPYRASLQLFNLALALDREGDQNGAEAVYRRAARCGFPPAMVNLANRLGRLGQDDEARELYRRATEAGLELGEER
jgi:tetratricopeptide (TPR) repeat protein